MSARRGLPEGEFRLVVYRLHDLECGTEVSQVQEFLRPGPLARMAGQPGFVEGFIQRRRNIVPVVDLRKRLGLPASPPTVDTCVLVARLPVGPVGFVVDAALELRRATAAEFEPPSPLAARLDQAYIQAMAVAEGRAIVVLDLPLIVSLQEQAQLTSVTDDA